MIEDLEASWENFETAYNSFLQNGNYIFVAKKNENVADTRSPQANFQKSDGVGFVQQQNSNMPIYYPSPNYASIGAIKEKDTEIERLREQVHALQIAAIQKDFEHKIDKIEQKSSKKKDSIGEIVAPLLQQHLPILIAAFTGQNAPAPAVAIGKADIEDDNDDIELDENDETITAPKINRVEVQRCDITVSPGFHSIDHAVLMLQQLQAVFPEFNINGVLQNLVFAARNNPDMIRATIQNYL